MTIRRRNYHWMNPKLNNFVIKTTGGTFQDYGIPRVIYRGLCTLESINGNLYPFDPKSRSKAVAHVEDRGRFTKADVLDSSPTFYKERYTRISYISITQYVYTFHSDSYAKKVFQNVLKAYEKQLEAYESMKEDYYSKKQERFDYRNNKKKERRKRVDSTPEKASKREDVLNQLSKKVSN